MQLHVVTSPVLGANCYVVAPDSGGACLVLDPGIGIEDQLADVFQTHALQPVAALVTHGHVDHTFGLLDLARRWDLDIRVHRDDVYRLDDPVGTLGPELAPAFAPFAGGWTTPAGVTSFDGDQTWDLAGVRISTVHAPGHTEGSTLYAVGDIDAPATELFTGDVLFAGTVGRTDLPGGDPDLMRATLASLATAGADGGLTDELTIRPGHGGNDTLGNQRRLNPFLTNLQRDLS